MSSNVCSWKPIKQRSRPDCRWYSCVRLDGCSAFDSTFQDLKRETPAGAKRHFFSLGCIAGPSPEVSYNTFHVRSSWNQGTADQNPLNNRHPGDDYHRSETFSLCAFGSGRFVLWMTRARVSLLFGLSWFFLWSWLKRPLVLERMIQASGVKQPSDYLLWTKQDSEYPFLERRSHRRRIDAISFVGIFAWVTILNQRRIHGPTDPWKTWKIRAVRLITATCRDIIVRYPMRPVLITLIIQSLIAWLQYTFLYTRNVNRGRKSRKSCVSYELWQSVPLSGSRKMTVLCWKIDSNDALPC